MSGLINRAVKIKSSFCGYQILDGNKVIKP